MSRELVGEEGRIEPSLSARGRQPPPPPPPEQKTKSALGKLSGHRGARRLLGGFRFLLSWRSRASLNLRPLGSAFSNCLELPKSVLLSSFFINLLGLALPLTILQVFDRILPNQSLDTLSFLAIGLMIVVVLEAAMKIARSHIMSWAALKQGFAREIDAVNRLLKARNADYKRSAAAAWLDRLDALTELNGFYGGSSRLILLDLPFVLIFFTVIALVGGPLVLVPLAVIACFTGHALYKGRILQELLEERSEQDGRRYDFVVECLKGILAIKSMAMEPSMQRRFERLQLSSVRTSYKMILHSNGMQSAGNLFSNVSMVAMVTVGAVAVMNGQLSVGALACCSLLSGRVVQPVLRGIAALSELQNVKNCHKRAEPLFALPEASFEAKRTSGVRGAITIRDLAINKHDGQGKLFEELSLSVAPGQIIGVRGSDGSGRTRLIDAIRGEVVPDQGTIHIDGTNVMSPAFQEVQKAISYIGSDAPVFRGSVIENITMFRAGEFLDAGRAAARLIGLEDDIHLLSEGYDTIIGEGVSDTLSAGLQQRIGIARVLVGLPKILLFDEANSSVDFVGDQKLRKGMEALKGRMTIIVISNRPSFLAICDDVYELDAGSLKKVQPNGQPLAGPPPLPSQMSGNGGLSA